MNSTQRVLLLDSCVDPVTKSAISKQREQFRKTLGLIGVVLATLLARRPSLIVGAISGYGLGGEEAAAVVDALPPAERLRRLERGP